MEKERGKKGDEKDTGERRRRRRRKQEKRIREGCREGGKGTKEIKGTVA